MGVTTGRTPPTQQHQPHTQQLLGWSLPANLKRPVHRCEVHRGRQMSSQYAWHLFWRCWYHQICLLHRERLSSRWIIYSGVAVVIRQWTEANLQSCWFHRAQFLQLCISLVEILWFYFDLRVPSSSSSLIVVHTIQLDTGYRKQCCSFVLRPLLPEMSLLQNNVHLRWLHRKEAWRHCQQYRDSKILGVWLESSLVTLIIVFVSELVDGVGVI